MGHQNEPLFGIQIPAHQLPSPDIQMVCGLINEQEVILPGKQYRQLQLRLLSVAQGAVGTVQHLVIQLQLVHFTLHPPVFIVRIHGFHRIYGKLPSVRHGIREIGKPYRCGNTPLIRVPPQKQVQKGGLTPSVPAGKAQTPVGINLKADILKNVFIAAVIGKG